MSLFSIGSISADVLGYAMFYITYALSTVASVIMVLETFLISIFLRMSDSIVNTFAVQTGFSVMLSLANLGFVLAIIIIAIMTILHFENYGMRKTLWRLIVAAILVNFSLVIGGALINVANTFTNSFLQQLPGVGPSSPGPLTFAKEIAGAFEPQRLLLGQKGEFSSASESGVGTEFIAPFIGIVFALALLVIIIVTLAVFGLMLLIRYVVLSLLLIIMPFAWLLWLFPSTNKHWTRWWNEFIRWTFFSPIVVFFLWLAIATAQAFNSSNQANPLGFLSGTVYGPSANNPLLGGIEKAFGGIVAGMATQMTQGILIVGLAIGGIYAADQLSIMGAKAGIGAIKSAGGFAGRFSLKHGRRLGGKLGANKVAEKMRRGNLGPLSKIPFARRVASNAGRVLQANLLDMKTLDESIKEVPKDPKKIEADLEGDMNLERQLAHLMKLLDAGRLNDKVQVNGTAVMDFLEKNKGVIERTYDGGKFLKDADKAVGSDKNMRDLQKTLDGMKGEEETPEYKDAVEKLDVATASFLSKLNKGDMHKMNADSVFGNEPPTHTARSLANYLFENPQLATAAMGSMNSKTLQIFRTLITDTHTGKKSPLEATYKPAEKIIQDEFEKAQEGADAEFTKAKNRAEKDFNDFTIQQEKERETAREKLKKELEEIRFSPKYPPEQRAARVEEAKEAFAEVERVIKEKREEGKRAMDAGIALAEKNKAIRQEAAEANKKAGLEKIAPTKQKMDDLDKKLDTINRAIGNVAIFDTGATPSAPPSPPAP